MWRKSLGRNNKCIYSLLLEKYAQDFMSSTNVVVVVADWSVLFIAKEQHMARVISELRETEKTE